MRNFIKDVKSKNKSSSYKDICDKFRRQQWDKSTYGIKVFDYLKSIGLNNLPFGSSGSNINVDDPSNNHDPLVGYSNELTLYNGLIIHDETNLDTYKFTTFISNPQKEYRSDLYYYFNITSHGNNYRIGFITDSSHDDGVYVNNSSTIKPSFYYDSATGDCIMGSTIIRTDLPNRSSLFIRIDEDLNFYIGRTDTNYRMVGNIMDYQSFVNVINLPLRLCYEVETNVSPQFKLELNTNGYKEYSQKNIHGTTWPNWGIKQTNRLLNDVISSSSDFESYIISPIIDLNWGSIASFTLKCNTSNIEKLYIGTTSDLIIQSSSTLMGIGMEDNGIYYDSFQNKFMDGNVDNGLPNVFPFPNPNDDGGQIYFKVDENRNIYCGVGPSSNSLIGQFPPSTNPIKFYIITKSILNVTGSFSMVDIFDVNPSQQTIPLDPLDNHPPLVGYTTLTQSLQNGTNEYIITNMNVNNYNTYISIGDKYYGTDVYWELNITPNGNTNIKIGIYTDSTIADGIHVSPSQLFPQIYYDWSSGKCFINNVLLKTIPDKLDTIVIRIDEDLNIYIGRTLLNYSLLLNLKDYQTLVYDVTKSFRLGYTIYAITSNFTIATVSSGFKQNSQLSTVGINWPNWGVKDVGLYSLRGLTSTLDLYKIYLFDTIFGATWGNDYSFTLQSLAGANIQSTRIFISTNAPSTFSSSNPSSLIDDSTSFIFDQNLDFFYNNAVNVGNPHYIPYPNLNENSGQIFFRIDSLRRIYVGFSASTQFLTSTLSRSGSIYIGLMIYSSSYSGYAWNINPTFKFIPNNYTSPSPSTNILDTQTNHPPLTGFTSGTMSLNGSTNITNVWSGVNTYKSNVIDVNQKYRRSFYFHIYYGPIDTKIGILTDGSIVSGNYNIEIIPTFYYESSTGDCYVGTSIIKTLPPGLDMLFIYIDEDLKLYIGRTETNYDMLVDLKTVLPLINNNQFYARLCISQYNNNVGQSPTQINLITEGYKEFTDISTQGTTWPNLGLYTSSRFISATLNATSQFTRYPISFITTPTWGDLYTFTLQCVSSSITNIYFCIGTNVPQGVYTTLGAALGSSYICYDALNNVYSNEVESLGQPSTYPFPDIDDVNGTIYCKIDSLKNIYIGKGPSTQQLIATSNASGQIYISIIVKSGGTSSGVWKVIENGIIDPPLEAIPLNPLYDMPPLSGFNSSGVNLVNGSTLHNITGMLSGRYHTFIQSPTFNYGTDVFYYISITPPSNIKIGFYTNGGIASGNTLDSLTSNPPQFYYNSLNGECRAGVDLITTIESNISPVFIRMDSAFNFYVGRTETNYQLICNVFAYPLLTNSVGMSFRLGYEIKT